MLQTFIFFKIRTVFNLYFVWNDIIFQIGIILLKFLSPNRFLPIIYLDFRLFITTQVYLLMIYWLNKLILGNNFGRSWTRTNYCLGCIGLNSSLLNSIIGILIIHILWNILDLRLINNLTLSILNILRLIRSNKIISDNILMKRLMKRLRRNMIVLMILILWMMKNILMIHW